MQPLGEAPSVRAKARAKPEISRKLAGLKLATSGDGEALDTPEGTPIPSSAMVSQEDAPSAPHVDVDDERDADFAPRGSYTSKRKERLARLQAPKLRGVAAASNTERTTANTTNTKSSTKSTSGPIRKFSDEKLRLVVEEAQKQAMKKKKPHMAAAVHDIYVQSHTDRHLLDLLQAILTQTAGPEQINEFHIYVHDAKKKVRAAKDKPKVEAANGTLSLTTVTKPSFPLSATPTTKLQAHATQSTKARISLKVKSPAKPPRGRPPGKMNHSPAKRSGSAGSDSSLTSMTSNEDDQDAADSKQRRSVVAAPLVKSNGLRVRDHATERGSLTVPQRGAKRSSADAEFHDDADRERLLASKKQRLGLTVERGQDFPESSIRQVRNGTLSTRPRAHHSHRNTFSDLDSQSSSPRSARPSRHASMRPEELPPKTFGRKAKIKQS